MPKRIALRTLTTEEEAALVARQALAQGQNQAILIVPDSAWGTRIETAFISEFEQGGGNIPAIARFGNNTSEHSAMLTRLLKIDESTQRKRDLQSRIGTPLNFEPSRRDDFDSLVRSFGNQEVDGRAVACRGKVADRLKANHVGQLLSGNGR